MLREAGLTFREIHEQTHVPLSTLSGWLKDVEVPHDAQVARTERWKSRNKHARALAASRHTQLKSERLMRIKRKVDADYAQILQDSRDQTVEIALAFLYLGEGKKKHGLGLGSSDSSTLKFYIQSLSLLYDVNPESLRYDLHLRYDQDEDAEREYWSTCLGVSKERFSYCVKDSRTKGKPTRPGYHGVCLISGGGVEIQRRLLYLAEVLCSQITGD